MNTKSDSIMMLVKDVVLGIICGCLFVAFCNEVQRASRDLSEFLDRTWSPCRVSIF